MAIIQAPTGLSLASLYDVISGRIVLGPLLTEEGIHLSHEMGQTIFSERFQQQVFRAKTSATGQNLNFEAFFSNLPETPTRILGCIVLTSVTARILRAQVSLNISTGNERDFPFWVFDGTNEDSVRVVEDGSAVANRLSLRPQPEITQLPIMFPGTGQPKSINNIVLRGTTLGFGAGDVTVTVLLAIALAERQAVGSRGLPVPSW